MSRIYERSRESLKLYFETASEFEKQLAKYSLQNKAIKPSKRYGCSGKGGVPLSYNEGEDGDSAYVFVDDSDVHTLVIGATASKKSRLVAMPMVKILESARESMIIVDPKSEIFDRTGENLIASGYNVYTIDLRNPHLGHAWNPLAIPYSLYIQNNVNDIDRACEFVNDIANNLSKMQVSEKDPYWENSAASFFFGLIMLLFRYVSQKELPAEYVNIRNVLSLRNILCDNYYAGKPVTPAVEYARADPFIYSLLIGTIETAQNTQAGILSTFDQRMRTFAIQPSLLDMLATDDGIIESVRKTPSAVFLIVPDEKTSYHNLVSLFIKQSYEYFIYMSQQENDENPKQRINYVLDEFSSLPTIHDFPAMITAARSRDIRFTLFVQSKHQLDLRYHEEADTIRANCNNWIYLVSREINLLHELSTLSGTRRLSDGTTVPVLSITDLQRLDKEQGEALIFCGRKKPFISRMADINHYDGNQFQKPTRTERERNQYKITFDFDSSEPLHSTDQFDWNEPVHSSLPAPFYNFFDQAEPTVKLLDHTAIETDNVKASAVFTLSDFYSQLPSNSDSDNESYLVSKKIEELPTDEEIGNS